MKLVFKRVGAYIIDILIVSIISALLSNIGSINYQLDKYVKTYEKIVSTTEKYENKEITEEEYTDKVESLTYTLDKNSTITSIISIACLIGYFGIFQFSQNGRTVGKRVFKLQVKKYNEGNLNIGNYLLRVLILNNVLFNIVRLIFIYTMSKSLYMKSYGYLSNVQLIFQLLIIVSMFMSKENRGIHDLIAGTKVIDLKAKDENVFDGEIVK